MRYDALACARVIGQHCVFMAPAHQRHALHSMCTTQHNAGVFIFLGNGCAAFALNCTVFLLIGNTSALTMNIAGVVKDWHV